LDDELNVLPLSRGKDIVLGKSGEDDRGRKRKIEELKEMKESLDGVEIVGALAKLARTVDQVGSPPNSEPSTDCIRRKHCSLSSKRYQKRRYLLLSRSLPLEVVASQPH
jgi:hypothetical protein